MLSISAILDLELLEEANKHAVAISMENLPYRGFFLPTTDRILEIGREVDDSNFGACLDTGHAALFDSIFVDEYVCLMGKYLKVLRVHDNDGKRIGTDTPGASVSDWLFFSKCSLKLVTRGFFLWKQYRIHIYLMMFLKWNA